MLENSAENIDPIEELLRKKFQDHEEMPSPHVWDAISAKLQADAGSKSLTPFWGKASFRIAAGVIVGILLLTYLYFSTKEQKYVPPTTPEIPKREKVIIVADPQKVSSELPVMTSSKKIKVNKEKPSIEISTQPATPTVEVTQDPDVEVVQEKVEVKPEPIVEPKEEVKEPEPANLYEQIKKDQKVKEKRALFIEKKE